MFKKHQSYSANAIRQETEIPLFENEISPWHRRTIGEFIKVKKLG